MAARNSDTDRADSTPILLSTDQVSAIEAYHEGVNARRPRRLALHLLTLSPAELAARLDADDELGAALADALHQIQAEAERLRELAHALDVAADVIEAAIVDRHGSSLH